MNKVVYVRAKFKATGEYEWKEVPTGETKQTFLGRKKVTERERVPKYSDCAIDGELLAEDVQRAIMDLNSAGYEVVAVTPVLSGSWAYSAAQWRGYGYGYSYTEGVIIIGNEVIMPG